MQGLLGAPAGLGPGLEDRAVQLLVDAGDLGETQPRLGLVLRSPGLDAAGQEQPNASADAAALRNAGEIRRRGRRRA